MGPLSLLLSLTLISSFSASAQDVIIDEQKETEKKDDKIANDPVGVTINVGYWTLINNDGKQITARFIPLDNKYNDYFHQTLGTPEATFADLYKAGSLFYPSSALNIQTSADYMDALRTQVAVG